VATYTTTWDAISQEAERELGVAIVQLPANTPRRLNCGEHSVRRLGRVRREIDRQSDGAKCSERQVRLDSGSPPLERADPLASGPRQRSKLGLSHPSSCSLGSNCRTEVFGCRSSHELMYPMEGNASIGRPPSSRGGQSTRCR